MRQYQALAYRAEFAGILTHPVAPFGPLIREVNDFTTLDDHFRRIANMLNFSTILHKQAVALTERFYEFYFFNQILQIITFCSWKTIIFNAIQKYREFYIRHFF